MAERALVSVAGGIIGNVTGPLVAEQFKLYRGFKKELWKLESTVKAIEAVLEDAEAKQVQSRAVGDWLGKLSDILYEADDLLDSVSTEALKRKVMTQGKKFKKVRIFFFKSKKLFNDFGMANKVKDIREKLDHIKDERNFHLAEGPVERRVRFRDTAAYLGDEIIIGREDDKKAVIELLDADDEVNVSILSIVGMGGLGKSALARLIFNDKEFTKKFDRTLWVCVSDDFEVNVILKKILESATYKKPETDVVTNTLVTLLREEIDGKRYFLVLDDVWNEDPAKWSDLKSYLKSDVKGSKILVTTRYDKVASVMHSNQYVLKGLDEDKSWNLFKQIAFNNQEESLEAIVEKTGREIVRKCGGVPLAVKTIGWSLSSQSFEYWLSFREKTNFEIGDILSTLKLSFDKLPSRLKQCFVYCSLFPKDHKYDKLDLINLWIAQGFIELRADKCLEDVGHEYFMNLLSGSFFQEAQINDLGDIISCKMHDLMHDLAILVAGSSISIAGEEKRNLNEKTHFLAFHDVSKVSSIKQLSFKASMIRTFLCPLKPFSRFDFVSRIDYESIFSSFNNLRVLNLRDVGLKYLQSSISQLKHLRYLDISKNYSLQQLPESVIKLRNLQTLILYDCKSLKRLPRGITKLINLRYLNFSGCQEIGFGLPHGLGQLTNLQRLEPCVFYTYDDGLDELDELNNLRGDLEIKGLRHDRDIVERHEAINLKQKSGLSSLSLAWNSIDEVDSSVDDMSFDGLEPHPNLKVLNLESYPDFRLPSWILSLTSLVKFDIWICKRCKHLSPLSQLPNLKSLTISDIQVMEYISECNDTNKYISGCSGASKFSVASLSSSAPLEFFPKLEYLKISNCWNLKGWWKRDSSLEGENDGQLTKATSFKERSSVPSFPRLLNLYIANCPRLAAPLPICPNLEALELSNTSPTLVSSTIPLPKLKRLRLFHIEELETLPEDWGQNLTFLKELEIEFLTKLKLFHQIQQLTALKRLTLVNCPELEFVSDESQKLWEGPTALQTLYVDHCNRLTTIPNWIENCKSLEVLKIRSCYCFNIQRIKKETGEDWPKIAHILNFIVEDCSGSAVEEVEAAEAAEAAEAIEAIEAVEAAIAVEELEAATAIEEVEAAIAIEEVEAAIAADFGTAHSESAVNLQVEEAPKKRGAGFQSLFKGCNNFWNKSTTKQ